MPAAKPLATRVASPIFFVFFISSFVPSVVASTGGGAFAPVCLHERTDQTINSGGLQRWAIGRDRDHTSQRGVRTPSAPSATAAADVVRSTLGPSRTAVA